MMLVENGTKKHMQNEKLKLGDYVLATKWHDGCVSDHWCVGYYVDDLRDRYLIEDDQGHLFRTTGFRTAQKITPEEGKFLLETIPPLEGGDECIFTILSHYRADAWEKGVRDEKQARDEEFAGENVYWKAVETTDYKDLLEKMKLLEWIKNNLLVDSQLDVTPPGYDTTLRHIDI